MNKDEHDHKHCLELFQKLSEYLDNELDEVSCKQNHTKEKLYVFEKHQGK